MFATRGGTWHPVVSLGNSKINQWDQCISLICLLESSLPAFHLMVLATTDDDHPDLLVYKWLQSGGDRLILSFLLQLAEIKNFPSFSNIYFYFNPLLSLLFFKCLKCFIFDS